MAFVGLLTVAVPGVHGQEEDRHAITAYVDAGVVLTRIHGERAGAGRLAAGLQVTPRLRLGGRGVLMGRSVEVGRVAFQDLELDVGYGGVEAVLALIPRDSWSLGASVLVGAGNADVRDTATGVTLDADNFFVLETGVGLDRALGGPVAGFLSASWRWTSGVEELPGVSAADLRGPSLSLGLRIGAS